MEDIIKTAGVLIINDEKVLLVRHGEKAGHKTGYYGIPAGRFEEGENSIQCAIRELKEETGIIGNEDSLIKFPELFIAEIDRKDGKKTFSLEVFLCKEYSGNIKEGEENIPEWININKVGDILLLPSVDIIVKKGIEIYKTSIDDKFMSVFRINGILVLRWKSDTKNLTDEDFKSEAIKFISIVKQNQSKKIIVDMRNFNYILSPELIAWRNQNIISVYNEIGVERFAFISEQQTVKQDSPNNTFVTQYFTSEKEAENWLNS